MHGGIVHRVACHVGALELCAAGTHLQSFIVIACHGAVKLILQSRIGGGADVGNTRIGKEVEAGTLGRVHYGRAIYTLKAIHHQHSSFGL